LLEYLFVPDDRVGFVGEEIFNAASFEILSTG
jgi:hypothetical protein